MALGLTLGTRVVPTHAQPVDPTAAWLQMGQLAAQASGRDTSKLSRQAAHSAADREASHSARSSHVTAWRLHTHATHVSAPALAPGGCGGDTPWASAR
jgi:hypothetical protein